MQLFDHKLSEIASLPIFNIITSKVISMIICDWMNVKLVYHSVKKMGYHYHTAIFFTPFFFPAIFYYHLSFLFFSCLPRHKDFHHNKIVDMLEVRS